MNVYGGKTRTSSTTSRAGCVLFAESIGDATRLARSSVSTKRTSLKTVERRRLSTVEPAVAGNRVRDSFVRRHRTVRLTSLKNLTRIRRHECTTAIRVWFSASIEMCPETAMRATNAVGCATRNPESTAPSCTPKQRGPQRFRRFVPVRTNARTHARTRRRTRLSFR